MSDVSRRISTYIRSSMEKFKAKEKSSELSKEEVCAYTNDCGNTRYECVTDCFGILALITALE